MGRKIWVVAMIGAFLFALAPMAVAADVGPKGLLTAKSETLNIGGVLEINFVDGAADTTTTDFYETLGKFALLPTIDLTENVVLKAELLFTDDNAQAQEAYMTIKGLPLNGFFQIGLDNRFIGLDRDNIGAEGQPYDYLTITTPLAGTLAWAGEEYAIVYGGSWEWLYWRLSLGDGLACVNQAGAYQAGNTNMVSEGRIGDGQNHEFGAGLGFRDEFENAGLFDVMAWVYTSILTAGETADLMTIPGYTGNADDDTVNVVGGRFVYKGTKAVPGLQFIGEYDMTSTGDLDIDAYYVQVSYRFALDGVTWGDATYLTGVTPLVRYDQLNPDLNPNAEDVTWDRKDVVLGAVLDVTENVQFKAEYIIASETTNGSGYDNNEIALQFRCTW